MSELIHRTYVSFVVLLPLIFSKILCYSMMVIRTLHTSQIALKINQIVR